MTSNDSTKLSLFQGKQIRRVFHESEWWLSVIGVTAFLADRPDFESILEKA